MLVLFRTVLANFFNRFNMITKKKTNSVIPIFLSDNNGTKYELNFDDLLFLNIDLKILNVKLLFFYLLAYFCHR